MTPNKPRSPIAGGFLLAICVIAGVLIGAAQGQPSLGFIAGFGAGVVLAVVVWLVDRSQGR